MMKQKLLVIAGFLFLIASIGYYYISNKLPYYYQARMYYLWKSEAMQKMANKFYSDKNLEKYSARCIDGKCSAWVRFADKKMDEEISGNMAEEYGELANKSRLVLAWKHDGHLFFPMGSLWKFDKQFDIAYMYYPDGNQQYQECRNSDYKASIFGQCDVRLSDKWSLNYHWINIDKFDENKEVPNEEG